MIPDLTRPGVFYIGFACCLCLSIGSVVSGAFAQDVVQFNRLNSSPLDRELTKVGANSEGAQGIATTRDEVFYSNTDAVFKMNAAMTETNRLLMLTGVDFGSSHCNHVGGIDAYVDEVYVALDGCNDGVARLVVLSTNLQITRFARLPELEGSFPWVTVNPLDPDFIYTVSRDGRSLIAFKRLFEPGARVNVVKTINFRENPADVLGNFRTQGGDFSPNGLFLRTVDDAKDEDSFHTGIWVYEIPYPITDLSTAVRVGFVNIRYDPDVWAPGCGSKQCKRSDELEDLDAASTASGPFQSVLHVLFLSNELDEDNVSVHHFAAADLDSDGVSDMIDNCLYAANPEQIDLDLNGVGFDCDHTEFGSFIVPLISFTQ